MLKGYGRAGDLGGAELMFELMANDRDQRPDVVALNSLLDACVRNSDLRRAVEILDQVCRVNDVVLMCIINLRSAFGEYSFWIPQVNA